MEKKRYSVTLTESSVEQMKADIKRLGLPSSMFSGILDEAITMTLGPMMHRMAEKKAKGEQITFEDVISDAFQAAQDALRR